MPHHGGLSFTSSSGRRCERHIYIYRGACVKAVILLVGNNPLLVLYFCRSGGEGLGCALFLSGDTARPGLKGRCVSCFLPHRVSNALTDTGVCVLPHHVCDFFSDLLDFRCLTRSRSGLGDIKKSLPAVARADSACTGINIPAAYFSWFAAFSRRRPVNRGILRMVL